MENARCLIGCGQKNRLEIYTIRRPSRRRHAHIRAKDEDHAVQILESYLNHWINNREIPPNVKNCIIDENPLSHV